MQTEKRSRGRPRKKEGTIQYQQFARAGIVMSAYDEIRQGDEKHALAVRQVVQLVRQRHPEFRISETTVRRILAEFRPRNSSTILRFERFVVTEEERARIRCMLEQAREKGGLKVPVSTEPSKPTMKVAIRFGERPGYPRFNRKIPKE